MKIPIIRDPFFTWEPSVMLYGCESPDNNISKTTFSSMTEEKTSEIYKRSIQHESSSRLIENTPSSSREHIIFLQILCNFI